jgi:phosphinothricin acetyltransferase
MNIKFNKMSKISNEQIKEVIDIFNYYIENSYAAYPENKMSYKFFNKFIEMTKNYPSFILLRKDDKKVLGFCFLQPYNAFPVFNTTAKITYFLEKKETGKGFGKIILEKLEKEAKDIGIINLLADISSKNFISIKFHLKNGFKECGRFHNIGIKKGKKFDVIWMEKTLT